MRRLPLALAALLIAPLATAQVYKWTDAQGTVHYSQSPPPQGVSFKQIRSIGSAAPRAPAAQPASSDAPAPAGPAIAGASTVPDTPQNRTDLCKSLESNLAVLKGNAPVIMERDGKSVALDAPQRSQQLAQAQAQYTQFCNSR